MNVYLINLRKLGVPLSGDPLDEAEYFPDHYLQVRVSPEPETGNRRIWWQYKTVDEGGPGWQGEIVGFLTGCVRVPYGKKFTDCARVEKEADHMHYCESKKAPDGVFCCDQFKRVPRILDDLLAGLDYSREHRILPVKQLDELVWIYTRHKVLVAVASNRMGRPQASM